MSGTYDPAKVYGEAEGLYALFNAFGRGRVSEERFVQMYLEGNLPKYIKKVWIKMMEGAEDE